MYLHLFLLLFSSGASSYFLPPKETPHLQNKTKYTIIDEMLCLLEAENDPIKEQFSKPLHVKSQGCAHYNTEKFIHELKKIPTCKCMKIVEKDMKKLEQNCSILKKSSSNDRSCLVTAKTNFSRFKESLEEFLKWVNQKQECNIIMRSESGSYPDNECTCPDLWKYSKGLL
uniref:Interleukin-7 n=1 Tax=Otus sunia TaxID=257818 RepID=A0A8C8AB46_9STRI